MTCTPTSQSSATSCRSRRFAASVKTISRSVQLKTNESLASTLPGSAISWASMWRQSLFRKSWRSTTIGSTGVSSSTPPRTSSKHSATISTTCARLSGGQGVTSSSTAGPKESSLTKRAAMTSRITPCSQQRWTSRLISSRRLKSFEKQHQQASRSPLSRVQTDSGS